MFSGNYVMQLFVFFPWVWLSAYCALLFQKQHSQYSYHEVYRKSDAVKQEPNKTGIGIFRSRVYLLLCAKQFYVA